MNPLISAIAFAAERHRNQRRKDTEATEAELVPLFGQEITAIVLEITDDKSLPKADRKRLQIEHVRCHSNTIFAAFKES